MVTVANRVHVRYFLVCHVWNLERVSWKLKIELTGKIHLYPGLRIHAISDLRN